MTITLNNISDNEGSRKGRKRVGRGIGSGKGKTCGRGIKGQKSRSGVAIKGFEGGQMPIHRRLPKRGFNNYNRKEFEVISLSSLQSFIDRKKLGTTVKITDLISSGLVKGNKDGIKLLASGDIKSKISLEVDAASETAIAAVKKAGGTVTIAEKGKEATKEDNSKTIKAKKIN